MSLRPFFGFYGGKWRDTPKHYPAPLFDTVREPFAGSAGYSLRFFERHVELSDIDPVIVGVWSYLIKASESEIESLPDVPLDGSVDDLHVPQEARWLIGFWLNRATSAPRKRPSAWMRSGIRPGSHWGWRVRETIAAQLRHIRHWTIRQCEYHELDDGRATWFIDSPYQHAGKHYRFGAERIDFRRLGEWVRSRKGQVIACENEGATWLPFQRIADVKTTRKSRRSNEALWLGGDV